MMRSISSYKRLGKKKEGFSNAFLSQWACNHFLYKNLNLPKIYDVSFVGRYNEERQNFINILKKKHHKYIGGVFQR